MSFKIIRYFSFQGKYTDSIVVPMQKAMGMIDISQHKHTPNGLGQKQLVSFCNHHFERYFLLHLQQ